jgi:hypothetical protein
MTDWMAPTLRDHLAVARMAARRAALGASVAPTLTPAAEELENPVARCPCGRETNADMLVDVRPVPATVKAKIGHPDAEYLCDGCRERLFREGHVTREVFFSHLGAPPAVLERIRAYRLRHGH